MYRFARTSLTTIALTAVALAALSGRRAQSADTDLQPAIQQMRDEIRELRSDVKALRALLEKRDPAGAKAQPEPSIAGSPKEQHPVAYFFYSKHCGPCQQMMPIIDRLRTEGYPIVKADVDTDKELQKRFNVQVVPTLWIEREVPQFSVLQGLQEEKTLRSSLNTPRSLVPSKDVPSHPKVSAAALPDLKNVPVESYLDAFSPLAAQASASKMTGNEIIASIGGQPILASEIFQRAFVEGLTPDGTSLSEATRDFAAGKITEQNFRELQMLAIRKFANDYIRTRALSRAMIASLGKTEREKAEDAVAKEFNKYVEKLKTELKVDTVSEVDKRLRKQGTSLLSLKDEFSDRLLADEYLRKAATRADEPPLKRAKSQAVAPLLDRHVTVDCDKQPLSEVLDQIFRDRPKIAEPQVILIYPVADLLTNPAPQSGVVRAEKIDFNSLEKLIRTAVEPKSWDEAGGEGYIQHNEKTLSLVIRQTPEIHGQIRSLLQEIRRPQQVKISLRATLLDQRHHELVEGGLDQAPAPGQTATLLTKGEADRLLNVTTAAYSLKPYESISVTVGKETSLRSLVGEPVWPESVQAIMGQIGGRAYIWFELTGCDLQTGQPLRAGAISLAPDFKPVLIELKTVPAEKPSQKWPFGPSHTVDEWAKGPPTRKFLLIRPEVENRGAMKEQEEVLKGGS
jgi:thiol-disulfide isomerase/thioredoxin